VLCLVRYFDGFISPQILPIFYDDKVQVEVTVSYWTQSRLCASDEIAFPGPVPLSALSSVYGHA